MLTGRPLLADEALSYGLVSRIAADEDVLAEALVTARMIAANSPYAVKHSKQVMWANLEAPNLETAIELENHVQTLALLTDDFAEACSAFIEKRPPIFRGR
jgi:enoyl-CoA hydratase